MFESVFTPDEEQLRPLRGRGVCVMMNDGTRHFGILTSCGRSSIVLNGDAVYSNSNPAGKNTARNKRSRRPTACSRKANIKSGSVTEREHAAESAYWGGLSMGSSSEFAEKKVVLPVSKVEAVLLL